MAHKKTKLAVVPKITESEQIVADLKNQIEAATKSQSEKLAQSKEYLLTQLDMVSKKYLTVNGYMQARTAIEDVAFGDTEGAEDFPEIARGLAIDMSELAVELGKKLEGIDVADLDESFIESYLDTEFVKSARSIGATAFQLLVINLLQNVGPSIDDIVGFREGTQSEIDKLAEALAAHETKPE